MSESEVAETPEVNAPAESPRLVRRGWNPPIGGVWGWFSARRVRRLLVTALGVALLCWLAWLVWAPFEHPRVQMVCLSGGDYSVLKAPPIAFAAEDTAGLATLSNLFDERFGRSSPYVWDNFSDPAKLRQLGAKLRAVANSRSDTLIVMASAEGMLENGQPFLLCRNFDPANPSAGRVPLRDFLRQVRNCRAGKKVVILDIGRVADDPRLGFVWNDLARRAADAVQETGDESLWLLTASSEGQPPLLTPAIDRSVFGYALQQGLFGAADSDGDGVTSLAELHRFTSATVSDWTAHVTAGAERQYPMLAWGAQLTAARGLDERALKELLDHASSEVILAPVASDYDPEEVLTFADQVKIARKSSRGETWRLALQGETGSQAIKAPAREAQRTSSQAVARDALTTSLSRIRLAEVGSAGQLRAQAEAGARDAAQQATEQAAASSSATTPPTAENGVATTQETPTPAAETTPETASASNGTKPAAKNASSAERTAVPKKFIEAWKLRDRIAEMPDGAAPRDYAPHLWRELQRGLLGYELQYRAGRIGNLTRIRAGVDRIIAGEKLLLEAGTNPDVAPTESGPGRMLLNRPWAAGELEYAHSAAMENLIATRAHREIPLDARAALTLDSSLVEDPAALWARLKTLSPGSQQYAEARGAATLAQASPANWTVEAKAWQALLASETLAAAGPWMTPWAKTELDAGDQLRWEAERELKNAIGADYAARAGQLLDQAMNRYQLAAENLDAVARARRMREELLERAPDYLRMELARRRNPKEDQPFVDFCEQLGVLNDLLATPDVAGLPELRSVTETLTTLQRNLEQPLTPRAIQELTTAPARRGDPLKVNAILSTTLPLANDRINLLSIVARLDARLISELKPLHGDLSPVEPVRDEMTTAAQIVAAARLHVALVRISGLNAVDGSDDERKVEDAYTRMQTAQETRLESAAATIQAFQAELVSFQATLADFYTALPRRIADAAQANRELDSASTRSERVINLRRIDRAMRLLDARDARRAGDVPVYALIDAVEWHEFLTWHADRAARAASESVDEGAQTWAAAAEEYRREAAKLFDGDEVPRGAAPRIVLEGPDSIDLSVEPDQEAVFTMQQTGESPADVWLMLNYDADTMRVESSGPYSWIREQELTSAGSPGERDAAILAMQPSLRLSPGQRVSLKLQVTSRTLAAQPARVVIRAMTRNATLRRALSVKLPSLDTVGVRVAGIGGTYSADAERVLLSPFPNRDNTYRWSLMNAGGAAKEVKVELLALSRPLVSRPPAGSLSAGEAAEFFDVAGPTVTLAAVEKMALAAGENPVPIAFPAPPADAAPAEGPPPPLPRFDHGLLLSITDLASGRVSVHRVDVAPQRPRRYVTPRVRYNAVDERIEIDITAADPAAMPAEAVRVSCTTAEPLPPGTQARLSDELRAPEFRATLWIAAPLDPARVITLALDVDDYPRAFIYRVPCQESGRDIPAEQNLMAARIDAPAEGAAFRAPASVIDVVAEVDIPRGAEDDPEALIELGFDADRDRDFRGETTIRLPGDRQVANQLVSVAPGGTVVVHPKVSDFELAIAPPGLVNNRVGVMLRVIWGDQTAFSESREIILDGTAPSIERVRVKPAGVTPIGEPIEVSCLALDGDLSGVASVEMTIDQLGTAEFEGNPPPSQAKLGADRRWTAKVDTATLGAGTYHVLVRAKDKVGNESEIHSSATVRLNTPEVIAAELRRATNRVTGTLLYGNSGFGGISVKLEAVPPAPPDAAAIAAGPPEPIAPVATNEQGAFAFDRVPPGKYKLTAEGVVRNKTRRAEAEVTVEPAPTAVRPLRLELR